MRTIDADVLKAAFETDGYLSPYMQRMIDACPTVEVLKHGEWLTKPDGFFPADIYCSECGKAYNFFYNPNHCPNCGAKMDGKHEPPKEE